MQIGKFRVLLLDTKFRNPNHYICIALRHAIERHPEVEFVAKAEPSDALALASRHSCNLFIAFDGEALDTVLCRRLARVCGRALLWVTEDPYEVEVNRRNAELFDLVFTNDSSSVTEYGSRGRHLPLAGAPEFHDIPVIPEDQPLRYELFFAGTAWPNRTAFIREILHEIPDTWRFKLALPTNEHLPPRNIDLPESLISWRTSPPDFGRFVNRSAATILLPRVFSVSGVRDFTETPPPRLFEAALAGGVQLVHESLSDVAKSFEPGSEIVLFSGREDFFAKTRAVVADRGYRNRIAQAARQRALRDHTYDQRVAVILSEVMALRVSQAPEMAFTRKTVLFVCHNVVGRGSFGGVEVYLDRLRKRLAGSFEILFYVPGPAGSNKEAQLLSHDYQLLKRYSFAEAYSPALLSSPEREQAFYSLLVERQIDFVHFHHVIGHVPALVHIAKALGVPSAFTVHDFFPICNEFNLISFKGRYCGAPDVSLAQCDVCLSKKHQIQAGSQAARRAFWNGVLGAADILIFNTEGSRRMLRETFPSVHLHPGTAVMPVPVPDHSQLPHDDAFELRSEQIVRIAILGNLTIEKGGAVILAALPALNNPSVEFHIFGRLNGRYDELNDRERFPNVFVHGPYSAETLPSALLSCEVSIHISIWPETYCLTLSEAWQHGIVPIVSDIGALGERVEHGVNGLRIRVDDEGELVDAVKLLVENRALRAKLKSNISGRLYETLTPHTGDLERLYRRSFRTSDVVSPGMAAPPRRLPGIADLGIVLESRSWHQNRNSAQGFSRQSGVWWWRSRWGRVRVFYADYGLKETTILLTKLARRKLWSR